MTDQAASSTFQWDKRTLRWLIPPTLAGGVVSILFDHFGIFQYFWIGVISIIALSFAVWENRSYHKEIWFWITLFAFTALHALLVMIIGERRWLMSVGHGTGQGVAGIAIADGLVITAVIRFPDWITSSLEWIFSKDGEGTATK